MKESSFIRIYLPNRHSRPRTSVDLVDGEVESIPYSAYDLARLQRKKKEEDNCGEKVWPEDLAGA